MVAVPMPAPMHSVTSPVLRSRRSSSSISVPRIIAPVAPSERSHYPDDDLKFERDDGVLRVLHKSGEPY